MYVLQPPSSDGSEWSSSNFEKFKVDILPNAIGSQLFTDYLKVYKYVKFNYLSWYVKCSSFTYDAVYESGTGANKQVVHPGFHEMLKNMKFYLNFDLDEPLNISQVNSKRYAADPHMKAITVNGNKAAVFKYTVPQPIRR